MQYMYCVLLSTANIRYAKGKYLNLDYQLPYKAFVTRNFHLFNISLGDLSLQAYRLPRILSLSGGHANVQGVGTFPLFIGPQNDSRKIPAECLRCLAR